MLIIRVIFFPYDLQFSHISSVTANDNDRQMTDIRTTHRAIDAYSVAVSCQKLIIFYRVFFERVTYFSHCTLAISIVGHCIVKNLLCIPAEYCCIFSSQIVYNNDSLVFEMRQYSRRWTLGVEGIQADTWYFLELSWDLHSGLQVFI